MDKHYPHLTKQQQVAAEALANGYRPFDAAEKAQCTYQAIWQWRKKNPHFLKAVEEVRAYMFEQTYLRALKTNDEAVETIRAIMQDGNARNADRLAAARLLIDVARAGYETHHLEKRLSSLEDTASGTDSLEASDGDAGAQDPGPPPG